MKRTINHLFLLVVSASILSSCAFGNKTDYRGNYNFKPEFGMPQITLGVVDRRPYISIENATIDPTYTGTIRSIAGIPYPVHTKSGIPLSEDMLWSIAETLKSNGVDVIQLPLSFGISEKEALTMLASKGRKSLLITLNEWRAHVYMNPTLDYDLKLSSINETGEIIESINSHGTLPFGPGQELSNLSEVVTKVFGELLNDSKIKETLLTDESHQPEEVVLEIKKDEQMPEDATKLKAPCTVQQILKMKEMGMTDQQISAACE
jgi:hypothetical protein